MNPTADLAGRPAGLQSHAKRLLNSRGLSGPEMASGAGFESGQGPVCGFAAPGPSYLMYELKSSTPDETDTYERISEETGEVVSEANGSGGIRGFPDRLQRFATRHQRGQEMAGWLSRQLPTDRVARVRARKLRQCGERLTFRHYFTLDELRLHEGYFCQQSKLCPLCAVRRGAKMLRRYTERVLLVLADRPELKMYLTTLTVRNGSDLGERMNHISQALGQLTHRRRLHWSSNQKWSEACAAVGSVGSFEIKRGRISEEWHPHFHDAWMCDVAPDESALSAEWKEITGDSHVVNVTPFHYVQAGEPATAETVARDFSEVFKYALKFSELSFEDNWHAAQQLYGRRLVRSFGALFGVKMPEDLLDDPMEAADLPYVELFYRFIGGAYELEHFDGDVPGGARDGVRDESQKTSSC